MIDIVFWSGGKDSYLTLETLRPFQPDSIALLATFDETTGRSAIQDIAIETTRQHAKHLGLPLLEVLLPTACPNDIYLDRIQKALKKFPVRQLVFGDLHCADIRNWREQEWNRRGYACRFPLWNQSYPKLLQKLWQLPGRIVLSSVRSDLTQFFKPGDTYNADFVARLSPDIDVMGENGEFHTCVLF